MATIDPKTTSLPEQYPRISLVATYTPLESSAYDTKEINVSCTHGLAGSRTARAFSSDYAIFENGQSFMCCHDADDSPNTVLFDAIYPRLMLCTPAYLICACACFRAPADDQALFFGRSRSTSWSATEECATGASKDKVMAWDRYAEGCVGGEDDRKNR